MGRTGSGKRALTAAVGLWAALVCLITALRGPLPEDAGARRLRGGGTQGSCLPRVAGAGVFGDACKQLDEESCNAFARRQVCVWSTPEDPAVPEFTHNASSANWTCVTVGHATEGACEALPEGACVAFAKAGLCAWTPVFVASAAPASDGEDLDGSGGASGALVLVLLICLCAACQCICCSFICGTHCFSSHMTGAGNYGVWSEFEASKMSWAALCGCSARSVAADSVGKEGADAELAMLLRREARYMLLLLLIPLACAGWTTCEGGMPTAAYVLYAVFLLRSKAMEICILLNIKAEAIAYVFMLLGMFDHFDWFTDGAYPVQAYMCDADLTDKFADAFLESNVPFMAPAVRALRFWGLAALLLLAAGLTQQQTVSWNLAPGLFAADVSGMAGVACVLDKGDECGYQNGPLVVTVTKVIVENLCQTWLQASGYALSFNATGGAAKRKLLASLGVGLLVASAKSLQNVWNASKLLRSQIRRDRFEWGYIHVFSAQCVTSALAWAMVAWVVAKLYFAHHCASHVWNLTSGCVAEH